MADPIRRPRRHPVPRIHDLCNGKWQGMGRRAYDHVSGEEVPIVLTVSQRGGRVYAEYWAGTRDKPRTWDR